MQEGNSKKLKEEAAAPREAEAITKGPEPLPQMPPPWAACPDSAKANGRTAAVRRGRQAGGQAACVQRPPLTA